MSVDEIVAALRQRAAEHRANGWELMREGDPVLLERAAIDDLWQQIKSNPRCHTKPNIEQFTIWN